MTIEGAVLREQGVTFAVVCVKPHVLNTRQSAAEAIANFENYFPGMPVVLMSQNGRGTPTYMGRRDIVNFLSQVRMSRIPWKRYTFS